MKIESEYMEYKDRKVKGGIIRTPPLRKGQKKRCHKERVVREVEEEIGKAHVIEAKRSKNYRKKMMFNQVNRQVR